jgi:hypothetical protein
MALDRMALDSMALDSTALDRHEQGAVRRPSERSDPSGVGQATTAEDAATFALRLAAPNPVIHSLVQGILETSLGDRAFGTYPLCLLDTDAVAGEEEGRREISALTLTHPVRSHDDLPDIRRRHSRDRFPIPLPPVPQVVSHFKVFVGAKRARVDGILTIFLWRTTFFL